MPVERRQKEKWITSLDSWGTLLFTEETTEIIMAEAVKKLKQARGRKQGAFTRKQNHVNGLIVGNADADVLKDEYGDLKKVYEELEKAHEDYVTAADEENTEVEDEDYLTDIAKILSEIHVKITTARDVNKKAAEAQSRKEKLEEAERDRKQQIEDADRDRKQKIEDAERDRKLKKDAEDEEKRRQADAAVATFKSKVVAFGKPSATFTQLIERKISFGDLRSELTKIESMYEDLVVEKAKVLGMNPTGVSEDDDKQFRTSVTEELERAKGVAFGYLKDAPAASITSVEPTVRGGGGFSSTKKEAITLPKFSGDEKTAFLKYPIWKDLWSKLIMEYEEKHRAGLLLNHLDNDALKRIIGVERDYGAAMGKIDKYYGDPRKVVNACLGEIKAHPHVAGFDYKSMINYKNCLINNYERLKSCGLEHEMSNTASMNALLAKFPIQENVKWQEYLAEKDPSIQAKPFDEFIKWLEKVGASWELLASAGTGARPRDPKPGAPGHHRTYFGEVKEGEEKGCYRCGEVGHFKRDCPKKNDPRGAGKVTGGGGGGGRDKPARNPPRNKKFHCAYHKGQPDKFCSTWSCPSLKYLKYEDRIKYLKENGDCEKCCGDCPRGNCQARTERTCGGNKEGRGCNKGHTGHELFCREAKLCLLVQTVMNTTGIPEEEGVLLQVMKIPSLDGSQSHETVLWDPASTSCFVRNGHARKMNFPSKEKRLRVCTLGGETKEIDGIVFMCKVKDLSGKEYEFPAYGLDEVTGTLGKQLGKEQMIKLFPTVQGGYKMCGATKVDYLIGMSKASWQPEKVVRAQGGGDLWIWRNQFGSCVGGSHPAITSSVTRNDSLFVDIHVLFVNQVVEDSMKIPTCLATSVTKVAKDDMGEDEKRVSQVVKGVLKSIDGVEVQGKNRKSEKIISKPEPKRKNDKVSVAEINDFFKVERLGTVVEPRCGGCICGKCPVPGSRYSFREESELKLIEENIRHDEERSCWIARYPYCFPRESLKGTREVAKKSMLATERSLKKEPKWGEVYQSQIVEMVERGAVKKVKPEELSSWKGHVNYLPHLAALNPRSKTTPVRICFDASRPQGGGPSLNQVLAKGPDRFLNNLAGVVVSFRNGREATKGDVKKMYNAVFLVEEDCYVQCFLWRDMDETREPETYQVIVNNIGVRPAGAIATTALYKSADEHEDKFPETVWQLKNQSYVDDFGLTGSSKQELQNRKDEADVVLKHGGMKVKKWVCSGDDQEGVEFGDNTNCLTADDQEVERMLGILWLPKQDVFKFCVRINLSPLKKKSRTGPDISKIDLIKEPPTVITRRQYYSQVQGVFDPIGLLSPLLLQAKILLRMTWEDECQELGWDDTLPRDLVAEILKFFVDLHDLEGIEFSRSLWPTEEVVGDPEMIIFSDGSTKAFGAAAYIRWKLTTGVWWPMLIMSKSKIAPKNRISIPRLELQGAVMSKRLKEFVLEHLNLRFSNVYHLVDSSTVLGYVHKEDAKLKPFEGQRVSEIQAAGKFVDGKLENWAWVEGENNPSDWATKPRSAKELGPGSFWQKGPTFLTLPFEEWPIKLTFRTDKLEGELVAKGVHHVTVLFVAEEMTAQLNSLLDKYGNVNKLYYIVVYMYRWADKSKRLGAAKTVEEIRKAKQFWIKFVQSPMEDDLLKSVASGGKEPPVKVKGPYRRLSPYKDEEGIWRVGLRLREFTPFTEDNRPPVLLPKGHKFTHLVMAQAHGKGHVGVAATVAKFRMAGFWTPQAGKLAKSVKNLCVTCRYLDHHPIGQVMGGIPRERLENPMVWGQVELDLMGPFVCRSDVNKRSTIKVWGAVLEDKNSGAVHCDILLDYSATAVAMMLRRFGALRGWPRKITSDPGSQLESASGKMAVWWDEMKDPLLDFAGKNSFEWDISPANSPWRQGKVEVRIKIIKRLIKAAIGGSKLSPVELQTVFFEVANMANERPIGVHKKPLADGSYKPLTPNCFLFGRSTGELPDDSELAYRFKNSERYELVQQVTQYFWSRWAVEVTPESVVRAKWHETGRNLKPGDIVLVHDKTPLKGKYIMAKVEEVVTSKDGLVRSCTVGYRVPKKEAPRVYTGGKWISLTRSVQRLTLLLPVEEQDSPLTVEGDVIKPDVVTIEQPDGEEDKVEDHEVEKEVMEGDEVEKIVEDLSKKKVKVKKPRREKWVFEK